MTRPRLDRRPWPVANRVRGPCGRMEEMLVLHRPGLWGSAPTPSAPSAPAGAAAAAAARYQQESVAAATPAELTAMLFTAALARMDTAREHLEAGKPGLANPDLVRAQDIVDECAGR